MRLKAEAGYDALTGLPNLHALRQYFSSLEAKVESLPPNLGYLMLDQISHTPCPYGVEVQAEVTKAIAVCISDLARVYVVSAHHYVLVPSDPMAPQVWTEITQRIERGDARVEKYVGQLLAYIGVAVVNDSSTTARDGAFLTASTLAAEARAQGEVAPRISEPTVRRIADYSGKIAVDPSEIFSSLRSGRLELYFQSIHSLSPARIPKPGLSGEILCRLRTRTGELLSSDRFIPLVEAAGRGAELDLTVIGELMRLLRVHKTSHLKFREIGINLTGQGLASRGFHERVWPLLARPPIPLSCFCFEVTQTAAISNMESAREFLQRLRAEGCRVAIDDFGTGRQSFARLKELPVDILKIDGSFVRNITQRGSDYALVQASVDIAQAFKAETVAKYVESEAIVEVLRELKVDWAQGFLFGEPQPLIEVLQTGSMELFGWTGAPKLIAGGQPWIDRPKF